MRQTFDRRSVLGICVGMPPPPGVWRTELCRHHDVQSRFEGFSEVPPNTTGGTGSVTATYDPATKELTWNGTFSGLTGPAMAAHFHGPAEAGKECRRSDLDFKRKASR